MGKIQKALLITESITKNFLRRVIMVFAILFVAGPICIYFLIYNPLGKAIKENLVHGFGQLAEAKYLSLQESVNQSLNRAELISNRAMIRRAMEAYHRNELSFHELQEYSESRYEDFAATIDRLLWSYRYLEDGLLVDYENESSLSFSCYLTPLPNDREQDATLCISHDKVILHVYSPVLAEEQVVGYDELAFDFTDIIASLSTGILQVDLLSEPETHSFQAEEHLVGISSRGTTYLVDDTYHWAALVTPNLYFVATQSEEQLLLPLSKINQHILATVVFSAIIYLLTICLCVVRYARREIHALEIDQNIFNKAVSEAKTDYLTQAGNRRSAEESLAEFFHQFVKGASSPLIFLFDVDNFKNINDTYGHMAGDQVITAIVSSVLTHISKEHLFFRWGGDEFLLVASNLEANNAPSCAQTLIDSVSTLLVKTERGVISPSISVGVSLFLATDNSYMGAIKRADQALYQAKKGSQPRFMSLFEP